MTLFSLIVPDLLRLATTEEFIEGYRLVPLLCVAPWFRVGSCSLTTEFIFPDGPASSLSSWVRE